MTVGQICKSLQGHDKDALYMVVAVESDGFVRVVDGKYKKQTNPKRKNQKHLSALKCVFQDYVAAKEAGKTIPDCEIMHYLKTLSASKNFNGGESSV